MRTMILAVIALALAGCQPADIRAAAREKAIEILERQTGAKDAALYDVTYGITKHRSRLWVCGTASAANMPARRVNIDVLNPDDIANTAEDQEADRLAGTDNYCIGDNADRFSSATPEQQREILGYMD